MQSTNEDMALAAKKITYSRHTNRQTSIRNQITLHRLSRMREHLRMMTSYLNTNAVTAIGLLSCHQ